MEDGVKEELAQSKEPKFLVKAGWVKKAPGKLLASYKDRYIHLEKTNIVLYESEDLLNCLEKLDLENYDKCHELRSPFNKKHRLILIRSTKSANKVSDVKFQTQTAEDKEAWIKALTDGINRAKNKVFDEVKVDESSNLEHVTRTRPKGNRNRRPPTRIHMKEVADVSSDGLLRLDLDLEDAVMPNGNHYANVDGTENPKISTTLSAISETAEKPSEASPEEENESEVTPQKKVLKPPMPPTKEVKPISESEEEPDKHDGQEKKLLKPPMPPSKEAKPSTSVVEETAEEAKVEKTHEKSPDAKKQTGPPPTPPNKPICKTIPAESRLSSHSPTPPPKDKKLTQSAVDPDQQIQGIVDKNIKNGEENTKDIIEIVSDRAKAKVIPKDNDKIPWSKEKDSEEKSQETTSSGLSKASSNEARISIESSGSSPQVEEASPKSEVPSIALSLNDPLEESIKLSPLLCHLPGEKKKKAEEKSVDSGQHSDDDSEGSGSEDVLAASTAALRGSHAGLDALDTSEDNPEIPVSLQPLSKHEITSKIFSSHRTVPPRPQKSTKVRSASIGDLLSDSAVSCIQVSENSKQGFGSDRSPGCDPMKLETEVALEMEKTSELLRRVSKSQGGGDKEDTPEDLLARAMEKLKMAEHVLKEVNKLKLAKKLSNRMSW